MIKKILSIFFIIILILPINSKVFAATNTTDDKLKQVQNTKKDLQSKIQSLDNEINDILKKIDSNKKDMNALSKSISLNTTKLANEEKSLKQQNTLMNKRLRAMYMSSGTSYIEVIFNSNSIGDFLSRVDTISKVMQYDKELISNIEQQKLATNKQAENLNNENIKLNSLKAANESTLSKMSSDIKTQNDLLSKATDQEKSLIAEQKEKAAAAERARQQAAAQSQALAASKSSGTFSPTNGAPPAGSYSTILNLDATAYSSGGYTASGTLATRNPSGYSTIAVDPRVILPGTKVYVSGYGYASADDTGLAIQGNIIDVYFSTEAEALNWGIRSVQVYILK